MLTVHGRTREMKGIMTRLADWQQIKAVKQAVHVPVYGNGNIQWMANVEECVMETGVDGVVVAEALLHNPAFFSSRHIPCWRLCDQYLSIYHKYPTHVSHARAHLFKILHHILQLPENVSLRDAMTKSKTLTDLIGIVNSVRTLYEIKTEEQTLEMTTLPVPVYVAQPLYRIDRVVGPSHEVADAKRKSDAISEEEGGMGVGKKRKSGKEDRLKNLQLCAGCPNPRGLTCPFLFCRTCCLKDESRKGCGNHRKARKKNNFIGHDV